MTHQGDRGNRSGVCGDALEPQRVWQLLNKRGMANFAQELLATHRAGVAGITCPDKLDIYR